MVILSSWTWRGILWIQQHINNFRIFNLSGKQQHFNRILLYQFNKRIFSSHAFICLTLHHKLILFFGSKKRSTYKFCQNSTILQFLNFKEFGSILKNFEEFLRIFNNFEEPVLKCCCCLGLPSLLDREKNGKICPSNPPPLQEKSWGWEKNFPPPRQKKRTSRLYNQNHLNLILF